MKKFLCSAVLVLILSACASSLEVRVIKLGLLSKLNTTEEEFSAVWHKTYAPNNEKLNVLVKFYDSLSAMQMALNAGEIDDMVLPEAAAEYVLNMNPNLEATLTLRSRGMGLVFGFKAEDETLRRKFNEALRTMRRDWILSAIEGMYLSQPGRYSPEPVKFKKFPNANTIRVAVTGDLPPIDFIAADGTPAGYNTAVLSEIGNILHVNIELVNIEAGARASALASGRVDVVFWYEFDAYAEKQHDVPDGVILSEPYYEWDKFIHVRKAASKASEDSGWSWKSGIFDIYGIGR